jgi:hypothetical protein
LYAIKHGMSLRHEALNFVADAFRSLDACIQTSILRRHFPSI